MGKKVKGQGVKKDPGVPKLNNVKHDLQQIQAHKKRVEEDKLRQKEKRKVDRERRRKHSFEDIAKDSLNRVSHFEHQQEIKRDQIKDATFHDPKLTRESSKKAYYREFKKVVEASDIILEVLDARDPLGCRCFAVEQYILSRDANKKIILILNKIDLVPKENIEQWLKFLRNFYPTIAFRCSLQEQKRTSQASSSLKGMSEASQSSRETLGAGALLSLLKQYSLNLKLKTSVTVGIIGYPNVGKSSLINSLKRQRSVGVGATPGFTKTAQEIHLDKNIKLLDSPGIVFTQGNVTPELVLRNAIKLEKVEDPIVAVEALMSRCSREKLMATYGLKTAYRTTNDFLTDIATKRGKLGHGGKLDLVSAARSILRDWITGRLPFFSLPPTQESDQHIHLDAKVVSSFSDSKLHFFDQLDRELMEALPDVDAASFLAVAPSGGLEALKAKSEAESVREMMKEDEEEDEEDEEEGDGEEMKDGESLGEVEGEKCYPTSTGAVSQNKKIWDDEENNPRRNQIRRKEQKKKKKKNRANSAPTTLFLDGDGIENENEEDGDGEGGKEEAGDGENDELEFDGDMLMD